MTQPNFDVLVQDLIERVGDTPLVLSNLTTRRPNWRTAKSLLNSMIEQRPEFKYIILAFVLYSTLKWSLYGENMTDLIQAAEECEESRSFFETRDMLYKAFGVQSELRLTARTHYYDSCRAIIELVSKEKDYVSQYPRCGTQMARTLEMFTGQEEVQVGSRFEIKKYLPIAIEAIFAHNGSAFKTLMDDFLYPSTVTILPEDDECLYLYHNINLLLKEYARLYWACDYAADNISCILSCKTPQEVMTVTRNEKQLNSADVVLQFLLLISGAVALIKYYPVDGPRYARILRLLMSNRSVLTSDGATVLSREQEIAEHLGISAPSFSRLKKEAFVLLGSLLWGYDGKALVQLLTDVKNSEFYFG